MTTIEELRQSLEQEEYPEEQAPSAPPETDQRPIRERKGQNIRGLNKKREVAKANLAKARKAKLLKSKMKKKKRDNEYDIDSDEEEEEEDDEEDDYVISKRKPKRKAPRQTGYGDPGVR